MLMFLSRIRWDKIYERSIEEKEDVGIDFVENIILIVEM